MAQKCKVGIQYKYRQYLSLIYDRFFRNSAVDEQFETILNIGKSETPMIMLAHQS